MLDFVAGMLYITGLACLLFMLAPGVLVTIEICKNIRAITRTIIATEKEVTIGFPR